MRMNKGAGLSDRHHTYFDRAAERLRLKKPAVVQTRWVGGGPYLVEDAAVRRNKVVVLPGASVGKTRIVRKSNRGLYLFAGVAIAAMGFAAFLVGMALGAVAR